VSGILVKTFEITQSVGATTKNAIRSALYAINPVLLGLGGVSPTATIAFYPDEANVLNAALDNNGYNYDVSLALNFLQLRLNALQEIDVNGNIVSTINLNALNWVVVSTSVSNVLSDNVLPTVTLGATVRGLNIQVTLVASANLGTVDISNIVGSLLSPKGIEVLIAVDLSNYVYANLNNFLRLSVFTTTGNTQVQANVQTNINGVLSTLISSSLNGVSANIRFNQSLIVLGGSNLISLNPSVSLGVSISSVFSDLTSLLQINELLGVNVQGTAVLIPFSAGLKAKVVVGASLTIGVDPNALIAQKRENIYEEL